MDIDNAKDLRKMIRSLEDTLRHCKSPMEQRMIRKQLATLRAKLEKEEK